MRAYYYTPHTQTLFSSIYFRIATERPDREGLTATFPFPQQAKSCKLQFNSMLSHLRAERFASKQMSRGFFFQQAFPQTGVWRHRRSDRTSRRVWFDFCKQTAHIHLRKRMRNRRCKVVFHDVRVAMTFGFVCWTKCVLTPMRDKAQNGGTSFLN